MDLTGISLFASSGIGDLGVRAAGINVLLASELLPDRADLFKSNNPDSEVVVGDIWENIELIVKRTRDLLDGASLDFLIATPPCQGMSKNGQGKLLSEIRAGNRPKLDPRNKLIIPAVEIAVELQPKIILFENVPEMVNTVIEDNEGNPILILDYIQEKLSPSYSGKAEVVQFADFGIPQRRSRLITIYSRIPEIKEKLLTFDSLIPPKTHLNESRPVSLFGSSEGQRWVTVRDTIASFPPLDGVKGQEEDCDFHPLHRVPVLDPKKYEWIRHTPRGKSAFDNQCINPPCGFEGNALHGSKKSKTGINRSSTETPLYCEKCGELLPRPYTKEKSGKLRIMRGYTSAYKRMDWDLPAPTLTQNFSFPSSDSNIHPDQNRVLSLYEALTLHTITDYEYKWEHTDNRRSNDTLIRECIGESIPPRGLEIILGGIFK